MTSSNSFTWQVSSIERQETWIFIHLVRQKCSSVSELSRCGMQTMFLGWPSVRDVGLTYHSVCTQHHALRISRQCSYFTFAKSKQSVCDVCDFKHTPRWRNPLKCYRLNTLLLVIDHSEPSVALTLTHWALNFLSYLFKFSPTWSCVSLPRPTTSSGWKLLI